MAQYEESFTKLTTSTVPITVDFSGIFIPGETIVAITTSVYTSSGTDTNPSAILSGFPSSGVTTATQNITGGVVGSIYLLSFNATTSLGNELMMYTLIAVDDTDPYAA